MSVIADLKRAKDYSDRRRYPAKHQLLKQMIAADPDAFYIDSDDGKGIVGITHRKTGFRFHVPSGKMDPAMSKQANRFSELWRAGKLSRSAVQTATGSSRAAARPRAVGRLDEVLQGMRKRRGDPGDLGQWGKADEVYTTGYGDDINRRYAGIRGLPTEKIDVHGGLDAGWSPEWAAGATKRPSFSDTGIAKGMAARGADDKAWYTSQNAWDTNVHGPSFDYVNNKVVRAVPGSPESRHELGHWKQMLTHFNNPVGMQRETLGALRSLNKADPRLLASVISKKPGVYGNNLVSELQAQMLAARGSGAGAARLRKATATSKPNRGKAWDDAVQRSGIDPAEFRSFRREQNTHLRKSQELTSSLPAETGLPSAMEHLVRNYGARIPSALPDHMTSGIGKYFKNNG